MRIDLRLGDCKVRMDALDEASIDAIVSDPPYDLSSSSTTNPGRTSWAFFKSPEGDQEPVPEGKVRRPKQPAAVRGFMGMAWDGEKIAFSMDFWSRVLRVVRPGGVVKVFGGTRTFHRMAAAMEAVGFEDVHLEAWGYASGFPKSLNVGRGIDKFLGAKRAMKRTPISGEAMMRHGGENTRPWIEAALVKGYHEAPGDEPATPEAALWGGWGTSLKPAWEPILVGRRLCS